MERKNQEVEQARQALEEKAKQLALTSKYKSEFLANMSHELRTPLNSLLILSDQLSKNPEGNLTPKQVEFAKTIHSSGNDLLMLINDILDLSKIESGTVVVDVSDLRLSDLQLFVERTFRHVAEAKNVEFLIRTGVNLPTSMVTDMKRLQQILINLLSNAIKFTASGGRITIAAAMQQDGGIAVSVADTGIGIPAGDLPNLCSPFWQIDRGLNRKFEGTGLGLSLCKRMTEMHGGQLIIESEVGVGTTVTVGLPPARLVAPETSAAPAKA